MPTSALTLKTSPSSGSATVNEALRRMSRTLLLATASAVLAGCTSAPVSSSRLLSSSKTPTQAGLVDIRTLVPDIAEEIRYASSDNFVGVPIDGYLAPRCYLIEPAAKALRRIERALREQQLRLKLFDCYRPVRAVQHFVRWAGDGSDQRTKARYYPNLDKSKLLGDYIAPVSGHSRGATVDLTLLRCDPHGERCEPLDMGADFDFFDPIANTDSPQITRAQRDNRQRLRAAMTGQGFRNYPQEWWHYTLSPEPSPEVIHDVPVQ